jgi:hypothetical protein
MIFKKFKDERNLSLRSVVPLDERRWVEIYQDPSTGELTHILRERLILDNLLRWQEMKDEEQ